MMQVAELVGAIGRDGRKARILKRQMVAGVPKTLTLVKAVKSGRCRS